MPLLPLFPPPSLLTSKYKSLYCALPTWNPNRLPICMLPYCFPFPPYRPTSWSRVLVFLVNAPIVVVALQGYALLDLFLAMNILTTTSTFPLLSALWLPGVSATTVFLSSFISLFATCLLGVLVQGGDVGKGLKWTFTSQLNL